MAQARRGGHARVRPRVRVADRDARGARSGRAVEARGRLERVRIAAAVDEPRVGAVLIPQRLLDVGVLPVRLEVHLGQQERVLAVVAGRAVAVVVGELVEPAEHRAVLPRPHEERPGHAHLHVLDVLEVAVVHVCARILGLVEVGEVAPDRDRDAHLGHAVVERVRVAEAVPVQRVAVGEVRADLHAEVRDGHLDVIGERRLVLVEPQERRADLRLALLVLHLLVAVAGDVAEAEDVGRLALGRHVVGEEVARLGRRGGDRDPAVRAGQVHDVACGCLRRSDGLEEPAGGGAIGGASRAFRLRGSLRPCVRRRRRLSLVSRMGVVLVAFGCCR